MNERSTSDGDQQARAVQTPDGRVFPAGSASQPLAAAHSLASGAARVFARAAGIGAAGLLVAARGVGKGVATVWRLAGALDSALWRGVVHIAATTADFLVFAGRIIAGAIVDLFRWLPGRHGRAYSAISGVVLIVSSLWAIDEMRRPAVERERATGLRPPIDLDDPIVARLSGRFVRLSDVTEAALAGGTLVDADDISAAEAFRTGLVKSYVEQRLLAAAAQDEGLQRDPAVARRLSIARDRILASSFLERRLAATVTPETIEQFYKSQVDLTRLGDEVKARHIVVATQEEAEEIVSLLEAGADFGTLARARSIDRSTGPLGGEIGFFIRQNMGATLGDVAFGTPVGSIAPLFYTDAGWHILEVQDRRTTSGIGFAAVRERIEAFLAERTISDALLELERAREVEYYLPEPAEDGTTTAAQSGPALKP